MGLLSQRNPLWATHKIGKSSLEIGNYGCTLTCLAMLNNRFGANCTPAQVAEHLDWFTNTGLVLWNKINLMTANFVWRDYGVDMGKITQYLADFDNKAVILQLEILHKDLPPSFHWVLAEEYLQNGVFRCADPWTDAFQQTSIYGPVIGAAYFSKRS